MSRYRIGQALGLVVDVAREKVREVTGIADRERAYTRAMVDLATVCDDARRYLRERDAARAEVERLGDVIAGLREMHAEAFALAFAYHDRWTAAEDTANDAMREGLAACEETLRLAAGFLVTIQRQRADIDAHGEVVAAARAIASVHLCDVTAKMTYRLRAALRAFDEARTL